MHIKIEKKISLGISHTKIERVLMFMRICLVRFKKTLGARSNLKLFYSIATTNADDLQIQMAFCSLKRELVIDPNVNLRIGQTGGIQIVVRAMERHRDIHLYVHACLSLAHLVHSGTSNVLFELYNHIFP